MALNPLESNIFLVDQKQISVVNQHDNFVMCHPTGDWILLGHEFYHAAFSLSFEISFRQTRFIHVQKLSGLHFLHFLAKGYKFGIEWLFNPIMLLNLLLFLKDVRLL